MNCIGRSSGECRARGRYINCEAGEVCATTVQRNGLITTVIKRCKQRDACLNEQKQVQCACILHGCLRVCV